MTPIRPTITPNLQPAQTSASDAARLAAQRAFFDAIRGSAPAAAAAPVAVQQQPQRAAPIQRMPDASAPAPQRPMRPGSLLDIRV